MSAGDQILASRERGRGGFTFRRLVMSALQWKTFSVGILLLLMIIAAMVYGPIAAMLVEMFAARIRYTSMSVPYHIGNGWFGGFLPTTAFALSAATGDIYYGLWYPVVITAAAVVIGGLFLRETRGRDVSV